MDFYQQVLELLDQVLIEYTGNSYRDELVNAKGQYFKITGAVNDDDDDFESRMNLFNEWYLADYIARGEESTYLTKYLNSREITPELDAAFRKVHFTLMEFDKTNFRKQVIIEDYLRGERFVLHNPKADLGVVPGDIFIGRIVTVQEKNYLLRGMCFLPREVKATLQRESKRLRKLRDVCEERDFLLALENLKTKWRRYGHVDSNKIFVFEKT